LNHCKILKIIWKFTITIWSCIKLSSRCFCNPVYSASLCLIPHFIVLFVRNKMCLVAQLGKWLFRIIVFFGTNAFDINIGQKSHCRVPRVFKEFSFTCWNFIAGFVVIFKELQWITGSSHLNSRGFSITLASIKLGQPNWSFWC